MLVKNRDNSSYTSINSGATWLSIGNIFSRIIGILFIIFWMRWIGTPKEANEAHAIYSIGYSYYSTFILISTGGIPSAISRQIASYNAKEQFNVSHKLFKSGLLLMSGTGLISSLLFFWLAPQLARLTPTTDLDSVIMTIRSLAPALLIIPILSIIRGFFLGYGDMKPKAISQITEQLARVAYILISVYIIRKVFNKPIILAIIHTTFAAFIGGIIALFTLIYFYKKNSKKYHYGRQTNMDVNISILSLISEIVLVSIPFIIASFVVQVNHLIDMNTFMPIMENISNFSSERIVNEYSIFNANAHKLTTVVIAIALSLSSTIIPILTKTYTNERNLLRQTNKSTLNMNETSDLILHILQLFFLVVGPASLGMAIISEPLYAIFYRYDFLGTYYLKISCLIAISIGLYATLVSILQATGYFKISIVGILIGLIMKICLQYPLLQVFKTPGAMYSTVISFITMSLFYLYFIIVEHKIDLKKLVKSICSISFSIILMGIVGYITLEVRKIIYPYNNMYIWISEIFIVVILSVITYSYLSLKNRKLDILIGEIRAQKMRKKYKIK